MIFEFCTHSFLVEIDFLIENKRKMMANLLNIFQKLYFKFSRIFVECNCKSVVNSNDISIIYKLLLCDSST